MLCPKCGRHVERGSTLCPGCLQSLSPANRQTGPFSMIEGMGQMLRGVREAKTRSRVARLGAILIILILLIPGALLLHDVVTSSTNGVRIADLLVAISLMVFGIVLIWRWYR